MISRLVLSAPHGELTITPDPGVTTHVRLPSGAGKSLLADAILRTFTGEPGMALTADTPAGTVLTVTSRARSVTRQVDGAPVTSKVSSAADYRAHLPRAFRSTDLTSLVLAPYWWEEHYRGGASGNRALRDALLVALPDAPIEDIIRESMGDDYRPSDSLDLRVAMAAQTSANTARDRAAGMLAAAERKSADARQQLADAKGAADVSDARAVVELGAAWDRYDATDAPWSDYEARHSRWESGAPGAPPAYDEAAHTAAADLVAWLTREEAEREKAAAAKAAAEREAAAVKAAEEKARAAAKAEAEAKAALADVRAAEERAAAMGATAPTLTCPACSHTWSPS